MKNRNILAALAAVGLAAAVATPAMALENEFHGMFSARYINSNFNRTFTTDYGPGDGTYDPTGTTKKQFSSNFVEQRARLKYIAKASADLKLVTQFELYYSYWGNSSFGVARNGGGALGADQVNFETKSIYLDANVTKNLNLKLGMQPYNDSFKGIVFDADMAGILLSSSYGKFSPSIGFFRFADTRGGNDVLGQKTSDMFVLDAKYAISKDFTVGAAYYLFKDNSSFAFPATSNVKMNLLGVNAEFTTGPLTLNGFAIMETGTANNRYTNAFAGNLGAKLKVGPGTARSEFMFISGDNNTNNHGKAFYGVNGQSNGEHGYYDNEMVILGRDKNAYTTDNSIIYNSNNKDQGTIGGYVGYDLPINAKLSTAFNAGFAAVAKDNAAKPVNKKTGLKNESNYLGTEVNAEATYQLMDNLALSTRVAYVFLGDYYKETATNGTPVNPYDFKLIFKYTF